jgi:hypothetical protein
MGKITLETLYDTLLETNQRLTSLENTVTRIEHDHGEKLAFLCDNVKVNNEKHEEFEQRINTNESKIFNHNLRIEILEEKFPKAL